LLWQQNEFFYNNIYSSLNKKQQESLKKIQKNYNDLN